MAIQLTTLCEWCGEPITTSHARQRFCTNYCRMTAYREEQKHRLKPTEKHCPACYLIHAGECV